MLPKIESSFSCIRGIPRTDPRVDGKAHNVVSVVSVVSFMVVCNHYLSTGLLDSSGLLLTRI